MRYLETRKDSYDTEGQSLGWFWRIWMEKQGIISLNKAESELSDPDSVFNCLTRRFGSGAGKAQIRVTFAGRTQGQDEDIMTFLDALESLRSKGFPGEDVTTRRYEIFQRFISGVRSVELQGALAAKYAEEKYVTEPPTEEELRYVATEYVGLRKPRWERRVFRPTAEYSTQPRASNGAWTKGNANCCRSSNLEVRAEHPWLDWNVIDVDRRGILPKIAQRRRLLLCKRFKWIQTSCIVPSCRETGHLDVVCDQFLEPKPRR